MMSDSISSSSRIVQNTPAFVSAQQTQPVIDNTAKKAVAEVATDNAEKLASMYAGALHQEAIRRAILLTSPKPEKGVLKVSLSELSKERNPNDTEEEFR